MLETKYYKDFRHNYIILKLADPAAELYQCRMITGNQITGLLPCQERHINGEMLLYYEITSRQNLASLYENSRIGSSQIRELFMQLKTVWERMSGFLLNERNLLLGPEYIYEDVETRELSFLYYPGQAEGNGIRALLEFLLDKVDGEDGEAVELTYKMLELVEKDQFVLDEVLQWFEQDSEESVREKRRNTETPEEEYGFSPREPQENEYEYPEQEIREKETGKEKSREKTAAGWMIAAAAGFGILFYIHSVYRLSDAEAICVTAGLLLAVLVFLSGGAYLLLRRGRRKEPAAQHCSEEKPYQETFVCERVQEEAGKAHGNTIFIPWVENGENKLYGVGKGNKNHIDLSRLPLTAGKLAGSVDIVINDQSISRRHVKFAREENRVYMTDLNSTNGTFKNGLRLEPNTSVLLEPGDEIRLGKLKFVYR